LKRRVLTALVVDPTGLGLGGPERNSEKKPNQQQAEFGHGDAPPLHPDIT
jgi:hypothetical protein